MGAVVNARFGGMTETGVATESSLTHFAPDPAAGPVLMVELPRCARSGCHCHGRGSIVFLAIERSDFVSATQVAESCAPHPCYSALKLRSKKLPQRRGMGRGSVASSATIFYHGKPIMTLPIGAARSIDRSIFFYDLASIESDAFQIVSMERKLAVICLYQPPTMTSFELAIDATMPKFISHSEAGTVYSPAPLLLVQPGGWALGGFLARLSLLRLKGRAAQTAGVRRSEAPGGSE